MEPIRPLVPRSLQAFSLVELMVVVAIISTVTMIALLGQSNFDRTMLLSDTAYSVALGAREMQTFGVSSRGYDIDAGPTVNIVTNIAYGLHVTTSALNSYILFADTERVTSPLTNCLTGSVSTAPEYKRGNCVYESTAPADGIVQRYTFTRGFRISRFCVKVGATSYCSNDATSPLTTLDVAFMRPNTDTVITARRQSAATIDTATSAQIYLSTADGSATRGVCFSPLGQVSVAVGTCP